MHLTGKSYVPTLAIRPSEMNALEYVPGISKDAMVPLILLAPWATSKSLSSAVDRVKRAYPGRQFILDVDRDYVPSNATGSPAQAEFMALRSPANRFSAWWTFWKSVPEAIPCLQLEGQTIEDLRMQILDIQLEGREFCLRIELGRMSQNVSEAISVLQDIGTADFSVVLEGGWVADPILLYARINGLLNGALKLLDGRVPIVASCTSMIKDFTSIVGVAEIEFSNRQLVDQIRRNSNRQTIIYGDWGSTRPREYTGGRTPLPRVDYPSEARWLIARNRIEDWGFPEAALAIVQSPYWTGGLGVWGEDLIRATAEGDEFAIDTPQKNVAARVNIHLHRQALYGQDVVGLNLDEPWVD
ncbi:beta family protein [Paracoccus liaowanqingii]|nr:beta family protein [Paracoccus liaowanqingii]